MPPYVNLFDQVASEPTLASILAKLNASLAVTGPLTDAQLRAALVPVTGTVALDAATLAALESITVIGPLTNTELRATPVSISGTVVTGGLTDAQLRATPVSISGTVAATLAEPISVDDNGGSLTVDGTVAVSNFPATQSVSGAVTADTELTTLDYDTGAGTQPQAVVGILLPGAGGAVPGGTSAAPLRMDPTGTTVQPVSGSVSVGNFPASTEISNDTGNPIPVSGTVTAIGPLTDIQLRATPVPVSGTVSTGGLTDTQLRAAPLPISGTITANLGTIDGASTEATLLQVRNRLPSTVTATDELPVADDYQEFEALVDQTGVGDVLTFTFTVAVNLVVVHAVGASQVARATTTQTPTASLGARCPDDAPTYLPVTTSTIKVFAPNGMLVSVCGYRRT